MPWYKQLILGCLFLLLYLVSFCIFYKVNPDTTISPITSSSFLVALFLGGAGLGYIAYVVCFFIHRKIERDKLMMKERYWKFLIGLVVAIPFTFYAFLLPFMTPENLYNESTDVYLCNQCGGLQPVEENSPYLWWSIYYYFLDPGNQHSAPGSGAKIISATLALLGVFLFNGLLVTTILGMIDRRKEGLRNGRVRYTAKDLPANQFAVVIGANEIASSVIKNLLTPRNDENTLDCLPNKDNEYVVLQTSSDVQKVRDVLASHLTPRELDRVIIYNALRDSELEIAHLHLEYATEIYILGENTTIDGGETYHDAMNMRCLNLVAKYLKITREEAKTTYKPKVCHVMFDYQTTYSVFQFSDVSVDVKETLVFLPFNRYESWARKVLVDCIDYSPLDGCEGIKYDDDKRVHFVIVGMSKMGIAMGVQALLQLHFPNYVRDKSLKSRITFIDTNADKEMAFFKGRYATLFELVRHRYIDANKCKVEQLNTQDECSVASDENEYRWIDPMKDGACKWKHLSENGENFLDVEIEFIKGELESDGVRNYLKEISKEGLNSKLTIAICLTQTHQAVAAALYMPIEVYSCNNLQQILVYQREAADIITNLTNSVDNNIRYEHLKPFGMLYDEYLDTISRFYKAQLVNASYWKLPLKNKGEDGYEAIRDAWKSLSVANQWSNKWVVDSMLLKMRCVSISPERLKQTTETTMDIEEMCTHWKDVFEESQDLLAQWEHNRWNIEKLLMDFRPCSLVWFEKFKLYVLQKNYTCHENDKKKLKSPRVKTHLNICDFNMLEFVDFEIHKADVTLNNEIPKIIKMIDSSLPQFHSSLCPPHNS